MNAIEPGACWMREPSVRTFTIGESGFELYAPDSGVTRYLNETASFIWQLLDGEQSLSQVARELASEFGGCTAEQALADVVELAGSLASEGLAQPSRGTRIRPVWPGCETGIAPREWDVALTGKCNLSCSYCFFANEMVGRNDLSTEQWTRFFETLGTRSVCRAGGEVFVRKDLWELLDCVVANGLRYSILSNGTLIREDTITKLCEPARRRRLSSIQVSIDGSCAAVHDASRGAGSFERALRAVRLLKDAGFPLTVRLTVNKYNVDDLEATAKLREEDYQLAYAVDILKWLATMDFSADTVTATLLAAFAALGGPAAHLVQATAHRWRYADTDPALTHGHWWDATACVGMCGDWLNGGKVEGAWLSGQSLAQQVQQAR